MDTASPMIARQRELRVLSECLSSARSGRASIAIVRGEPGMGKSRLAESLAEQALKGMLKPEFEEVSLGQAEIREIFRSSKIGNIAGCMVTSGVLRRNAKVRLIRDGAVVVESADLSSLRREKDDVSEVREGFECGLVIRGFNDIKQGDVVEAFEMREIPRA